MFNIKKNAQRIVTVLCRSSCHLLGLFCFIYFFLLAKIFDVTCYLFLLLYIPPTVSVEWFSFIKCFMLFFFTFSLTTLHILCVCVCDFVMFSVLFHLLNDYTLIFVCFSLHRFLRAFFLFIYVLLACFPTRVLVAVNSLPF